MQPSAEFPSGKLQELQQPNTNRHCAWDAPETAQAYDTFASAAWYNHVLWNMVSMLPPTPVNSVLLDVGSGTGRGTVILAQYMRGASVIGVDSAHCFVEYAQQSKPPELPVHYYHGSVETLDEMVGLVQGIVCFNSIHQLGPFAQVLQKMSEKIEPGGFFAFCSAYTSQSIIEGSSFKMTQMMSLAQVIAEQAYPHLFDHAVDTSQFASPCYIVPLSEIQHSANRAGLTITTFGSRTCEIDRESIINYMSLPGTTDSVLPDGIPFAVRRQIFTQAVDACGITGSQRRWYYLVALKNNH